MNTQAFLVAVIVAVAVLLLVVWYMQSRRREHLRERFGPEYDRAIRETGNVNRAESVLSNRERRVERLNIRVLSAEESARFSAAWRTIQARFVDDPKGALLNADGLITEVMSTRGYPMTNWDQ